MDSRGLRFVAHIDILGMSTIVEKDMDEAWGMLSDLVDVRDEEEVLQSSFCRQTRWCTRPRLQRQ